MDDDIKNAKIVPAICIQCGAKLEVDSDREKAFCQYCGTQFIVDKAINSYNVQNAKIEHVESVNIHKKGAVESVLSFVEVQQNKKQQKIDEENRRIEEERRKQEEQREKFRDQVFNKKYRIRNIVVLVLFICVILIGMIFDKRDKAAHIGQVKTPSGSSVQKGENYQDVMLEFKEEGFTNIKFETIEDLLTGWITKDGEVESVSVDGDVNYSSDEWYPNDVEVVIKYHTFPKEKSTDKVDDKTTEVSSTVQTVQNEKTEVSEEVVTTEITEEPVATEINEDTESSAIAEDYTSINEPINKDLIQAQGWALGTLDEDGIPTEKGTPSPAFAFSLYIESVNYVGDKLRIYVVPEFEQLSEEDKTYAINSIQNMVNAHTNDIPYTTIFLDGNAIGNSKITDIKNFKWE